MSAESQVASLILFALVGFTLGAISESTAAIELLPTLIGAVATLFAAYFGASYAFRLSEERDKSRQDLERVRAGNRVIFSVAKLYHQFRSIEEQSIDPFRQSPWRMYQISPTIGYKAGFTGLDATDVSIFLESPDPNLAMDITMQELEAHSALEALESRSDIHRGVQGILEEHGVGHGTEITSERCAEIIGPRLSVQLAGTTEAVIASVSSITEGCRDLLPRLSESLRQQYPGHRIVGYEISAQQGNGADA